PYVTVVKPGTEVFFPNSDNIRHHVYSFSAGNAFERKLYRANEAEPVTLESPGIVALGCNIHDNMQAYVLVSDDVVRLTGATGQVTVHDNSQTLKVWHPLLGDRPLQISLQELETIAADSYVLRLPFTWNDPQAPRSGEQLESLLKQFSRDPG
ncbi:MAG: hypothetical protein NWP69_10730, partial [Congregibacter sp.]|nr:hypothetical protein [Congregibacter sp.]